MEIAKSLRKGSELGILGVAIAALWLVGCGGGGAGGTSNGNAASGVRLINVNVAGSGQYTAGTTVNVKDPAGVVIGNATTNSSGQAAVNVPSTYVGPMVVEAVGNANQTYFDPKTNTPKPVTTTLHAVVPNETFGAVGVTPLTEIASGMMFDATTGKIAISGVSNATTAAGRQAIIAINAKIGSMFGVSNPLVPPRAANATKPAQDTYGALLAYLSFMAAPGRTVMDDANDLRDDIKDGNWDGKKTNAAGAQVATAAPTAATIQAAITTAATAANAASAVAVGTVAPVIVPVSNVAAAVTSQQTAVTAQVAAVAAWVADATSANGFQSWWTVGSTPQGGGDTASAFGSIDKFTAVTANTWTVASSRFDWVNGKWNAVTATTTQNQNYVLSSTGWVVEGAQTPTVTDNGDGTVHVTYPGSDITYQNFSTNVLDAMPIKNPQTAVALAGQTYPVGSTEHWSDALFNQDYYSVLATARNKLRDNTGNALTAMPTGPTQVCVNVWGARYVLAPILPAPASGDNYTVYASAGCSAAKQTAALATVALGTVNIAPVAGTPVAVSVITVSPTAAAGVRMFNDVVVSVVNGALRHGQLFRKGTLAPGWGIVSNKVATDAELVANGLLSMGSTATATNLPSAPTMTPANFAAMASQFAAGASSVAFTSTWTQPVGTSVTGYWADTKCNLAGYELSSSAVAAAATTFTTNVTAGCKTVAGDTAASMNVGLSYQVNGGATLFTAAPY